MTTAFIFPGQGSQAVGMGKSLADSSAAARAVFEEVDAALSQKLSTLMWEGPADELTLTANAQPALMAVSLAVVRVLEAEAGLDLKRDAAFVAGHSLGEYSALAAAGTFSIADAARLLRIRGDAMQKAVPPGQGAMAALLGADLDLARAIATDAAQGDVCEAANDNGGGQVVLSGAKAARVFGLSHDRVPPSVRPPRRRRTGTSGSFGALSLCPDAAGGRSHARGPRYCDHARPHRPRDGECRRCAAERCRGHSRLTRGPGHRHGALARMRRGDGNRWRRPIRRARQRQGPGRAGEAHRAGCYSAFGRHGGRRIGLQALKGHARTAERRKGETMLDLTGKKALVTGATGGLGGAIARRLHAQGATIALSGTRAEALEALAAELGERAVVTPCNLADKESVEALVPAAEEKLGGLDILVNNAGVTKDNLFLRLKDEDWDSVIAINLTAAFRLSRAAGKSRRRRR